MTATLKSPGEIWMVAALCIKGIDELVLSSVDFG
jgi:hypothetical protein